MNKKITFLTAALALLAFLVIPVGMRGQTRAESVYSTCLFGSSYNPNNSSYTGTFDATNGDFVWTVANGNNNNNGWTNSDGNGQVKFGRKNNASVGLITTKTSSGSNTTTAYSEAITKVTVTIDALTADKINSIKLYSGTVSDVIETEEGEFSKETGTQTVSIASPAANKYYKIAFDCASGSGNGLITVSKVEFFYESVPSTTPTLSIDPTSAEPFTYVVGNGPSDKQSFVVTGTNLTSNITVSVPSDGAFEITDDTEYGNSVTIESGDFFSVRMKAGLDAGDYNATLSITSTDAETIDVALSGSVTEPITYTIAYEWVLTDLDELTEDDVFVIVGDNGDTYAMTNDNSTSSAPATVAVTVFNDQITSTVADNIQWNISGNATDGYTFYPNGTTATWLYCTNTNNGVRVGTNTSDTFTLDNSGYLKHNGTSRFVGIYQSQDWRCYTSINNNIANQTFTFYKREIVYKKYIKGYSTATNPDGGYYLIASPVASVTPSTDNGFIATPASDYDLYSFDPNEEYEWRNYKQGNGFDLVSGKGYLYASKYDTELIFKGEPYNGNGEVTLTKSENNTSEVNKAMNLVGNPYATKATPSKDYYTLNDDGSEIVADPKTAAIDPMVGIFVKADYDGETMTFTPQDGQSAPQQLSQIVANLRQGNRNATIDRAIVRFGDDSQLPKFMFNEDNTKLYIPQNGVDYAVVSNEGEAEMPINFKAAQNGTYTLCFEVENLEMDQLTLIDNLTGTETNLLACPSYTFDARTTDYASRFRLVFSSTGIEENGENGNFAYYNGSEWVINATDNATVEVIDMMGRVIRVCTGGVHTVSTNGMASGVYMMRLIDGNNVKTQKIVVR